MGLDVDWQTITGISTAIIALCALVFSIWQGVQARKHNKLSFRPHLTTWTHSEAEKGFYTVELINNGLGPAIIEDFVVKIDGSRISGDGTEPIEKGLKMLFPNLAYLANHSYVATGYSMAAKERCVILAVHFTNPPLPSKEFVEQALNRSDLDITYKSFYKEIFHLSTEEEKSNRSLQPTR